MHSDNLKRMIQLAEEVFNFRNDPDQLQVDQEVIARLKQIHPATMGEHVEGDGPVAWTLVIPTTLDLMNRFLEGKISEKQLFEQTPVNGTFEAIYLCSALVLEEFRRKGIVKNLVINAIKSIRRDHPIQVLFVWPFTYEGEIHAEVISSLTSLPLKKRLTDKI